jgi:hypothetical protein
VSTPSTSDSSDYSDSPPRLKSTPNSNSEVQETAPINLNTDLNITFPFIALAFLIWLLSYYTMSILGGTISLLRLPRFPHTDQPVTLPDVVFDYVITEPYCPMLLNMNVQSLVLLLYYLYLALVVLPLHRSPRVILVRFLLINALMFLTRTTTVSVTNLPQPNIQHKCIRAQNNIDMTFLDALVEVCGKFPPKACGDLIYSGHEACTLLSLIIFYREKAFFNSPAIKLVLLSAALTGTLSILACRSHYTVDVVLGCYFSYGLTEFYYRRVDECWFIKWIEGRVDWNGTKRDGVAISITQFDAQCNTNSGSKRKKRPPNLDVIEPSETKALLLDTPKYSKLENGTSPVQNVTFVEYHDKISLEELAVGDHLF